MSINKLSSFKSSESNWKPISKWVWLSATDKSDFKDSIMNTSDEEVLDLYFLMRIRDSVEVSKPYLDLGLDKYNGLDYFKVKCLLEKSNYEILYESDRTLFVRKDDLVYRLFRHAVYKTLTSAKLITKFPNITDDIGGWLIDNERLTLEKLIKIEPEQRNTRVVFRFRNIELSDSNYIEYVFFMGECRNCDSGISVKPNSIENGYITFIENNKQYKVSIMSLRDNLLINFSDMQEVTE